MLPASCGICSVFRLRVGWRILKASPAIADGQSCHTRYRSGGLLPQCLMLPLGQLSCLIIPMLLSIRRSGSPESRFRSADQPLDAARAVAIRSEGARRARRTCRASARRGRRSVVASVSVDAEEALRKLWLASRLSGNGFYWADGAMGRLRRAENGLFSPLFGGMWILVPLGKRPNGTLREAKELIFRTTKSR